MNLDITTKWPKWIGGGFGHIFLQCDYRQVHSSAELNPSVHAENGANVISPIIQGQSISNLTVNITSTLNHSADVQKTAISDKLVEDLKTVHKSTLLRKFEHASECIAKLGEQPLLRDLFTDVLMTEGGDKEFNTGCELLDTAIPKDRQTIRSVQCSNIFKSEAGQKKIRTVVTQGIAGIGKTMYIQKCICDWASGDSNQEFDFVYVFPFRELNLLKKEISLLELVWQYYPHLEQCDAILSSESVKCLFVFDGIDESRCQFDFYKCPPFQDERKATSIDVLLTNIIRGNLLPAATIWITSRFSATCQIPVNLINRITEIQGFDDKEREEYFRKRFKNKVLAEKIVTHIKSHTNLYHMCYVPSFCWVLASVFEQTLVRDDNEYIPRTLAEIYTKFLIVLLTFQNQKYDDQRRWTDFSLLESNRDSILNLARLAFENLNKNNVIFHERDLRKFNIDMSKPSVCTGVCKDIFIENSFHGSVYSFAHLTLQEYFAALHVFASYQNRKRNVLKKNSHFTMTCVAGKPTLFDVFKTGLHKAILNRNGQFDIFVRFLLGAGAVYNQNLLNGLFFQSEDHSEVIQETTVYIKNLIRKNVSPERCINLFHCLNELNDNSLVEELKTSLNSGKLSKAALSPSQYSALAFMFQMSKGETEELNLRRHFLKEEGVIRMLPIAKHYARLVLSQCCLTARSCVDLAIILSSYQSQLIELELGCNILQDAGVKLLCTGLINPVCKLQRLGQVYAIYPSPTHHRLKNCGLTRMCCEDLASILTTQHSSLRGLDLTLNQIEDEGLKLLSSGLTHPNCKLQKLELKYCSLTAGCCQYLTSSLCTNQSSLRKLELGRNKLGDDGVKLLSAGLQDILCNLQALGLECCGLTAACCEDIAFILCSNRSSLREIDLTLNGLGDSGLEMLCAGLRSPNCKMEKLRLEFCNLTSVSCEHLASVLSGSHSNLQELDLGVNKLEDSGVKLLCAGLNNTNCKIHKLVLQKCALTSKGCEYVALAACTVYSKLTELDLSGNAMYDAAVEVLTVAMRDPGCKLKKVCLKGNHFSWALKGELISVLAELRQSGRDIAFLLDKNEII
ncbi:NACHT, LRR and PYD domains-containing protein 12 [Amia ocellicauda]|uniref:NACHT, LRR and PYD domains-containing protein 12 n=1 Tax=Amia ocellicauda TaxID=2972642 RepID=UPI003464B24C